MSPAAKSRTLVRLLDTAGHRPLSDDEFETMKDVAVLDMLCSYWEQALERCARCGVARDLHRQWRVFVEEPFALPDHRFTPTTAPIPEPPHDPGRLSGLPPGRPPDDPAGLPRDTTRATSDPAVVAAPAMATLLTATTPATSAATAPAAAATAPAPDPAVPRRSWRQALKLRLRAGQQRPLSQP